MNTSHTHALRKYLEETDQDATDNADIVGFQIGPRINASGRMDTPLTALRWLLAPEDRSTEFFTHIDALNSERKTVVAEWQQSAMESVDTSKPILIYTHASLEHGIIGLIAGKLTESYHRPAIVLCPGAPHITPDGDEKETLVASCRSPEWCDLIPLLDICREMFVRYGGHRQAAGFTIEIEKLPMFSDTINSLLQTQYPDGKLPAPIIRVDAPIRVDQLSLETLDAINAFRPFGIGNPRPVWLLENMTIKEVIILGKTDSHLMCIFQECPNIRFVYWNGASYREHIMRAHILSCIIQLDLHTWNGKNQIQGTILHVLA